jgi:uncharacterized membrane protein YwaF
MLSRKYYYHTESDKKLWSHVGEGSHHARVDRILDGEDRQSRSTMRVRILNANTLWLIGLLVLAQWAVRLLFEHGVAPLPSSGLPFRPQSGTLTFVIGVLITALAGAILPPKIESVVGAAVWMLFILLVMPGWVLMHSMGEERVLLPFILVVVGPIVMLGAMARSVPSSPLGRVPQLSRQVSSLMAAGACVFTALVVWATGDIDLSLEAVYERRLEVRDGPDGVLVYLAFWVEHAVVPVTLIVSLCARRWGLALSALVMSACPYLIYGSKLALLWPLVLVGWWVVRSVGLVSAAGFVGLLTAALWGAVALGSVWVNDYIVRRSLCVPPSLTFVYLVEWEVRRPMLWRDSPLIAQVLHGTPPDPPLGRVVGEEILGRRDLNASVDVFTNGFAEGWYPGVCLVGVAGLAVLLIIERICRRLGQGVAALIGLHVGMILSIQPLHSAMMSGGLLALGLLLWWCGRGTVAHPAQASQCAPECVEGEGPRHQSRYGGTAVGPQRTA